MSVINLLSDNLIITLGFLVMMVCENRRESGFEATHSISINIRIPKHTHTHINNTAYSYTTT